MQVVYFTATCPYVVLLMYCVMYAGGVLYGNFSLRGILLIHCVMYAGGVLYGNFSLPGTADSAGKRMHTGWCH